MSEEAKFAGRINIPQLREFLLHGTEDVEVIAKSYDERIVFKVDHIFQFRCWHVN